MKKLITVIALIAITLFGCNKQASDVSQLAPEKMNGIEFKAKYGFELPFLDYGSGVARSNKPKANAVTLSVTEDLVISGSVECTTSPNAEWGGIQKFLALPLSNDGAVSYCNFNWSGAPVPTGPMVCPTTTPGVYRGWTSDEGTYNVHLSPPLSL